MRSAANLHTMQWGYQQTAVVATLKLSEVVHVGMCMVVWRWLGVRWGRWLVDEGGGGQAGSDLLPAFHPLQWGYQQTAVVTTLRLSEVVQVSLCVVVWQWVGVGGAIMLMGEGGRDRQGQICFQSSPSAVGLPTDSSRSNSQAIRGSTS